MSVCPYCGARATDASEEVRHMEAHHPDVIAERLRNAGEHEAARRFDSWPAHAARLRSFADDIERYAASAIGDDLLRAVLVELEVELARMKARAR